MIFLNGIGYSLLVLSMKNMISHRISTLSTVYPKSTEVYIAVLVYRIKEIEFPIEDKHNLLMNVNTISPWSIKNFLLYPCILCTLSLVISKYFNMSMFYACQ